MKYCTDYAALLDLFVDGELTPAEMVDVQTHLDTCPGCRAYVDDALAMRAAFPRRSRPWSPRVFAILSWLPLLPAPLPKSLPGSTAG